MRNLSSSRVQFARLLLLLIGIILFAPNRAQPVFATTVLPTPILDANIAEPGLEGQKADGTTWTAGQICNQTSDECYIEGSNVPHRISFQGLTKNTSYSFSIYIDHFCNPNNTNIVGYNDLNSTAFSNNSEATILSVSDPESNGNKLLYSITFTALSTNPTFTFNTALSPFASECQAGTGDNLKVLIAGTDPVQDTELSMANIRQTAPHPTPPCDDENSVNNDGCTDHEVDTGFECTTASLPSICSPIHGDGIITAVEQCDDGNIVSEDGCTNGVIDSSFGCAEEPSVCTPSASPTPSPSPSPSIPPFFPPIIPSPLFSFPPESRPTPTSTASSSSGGGVVFPFSPSGGIGGPVFSSPTPAPQPSTPITSTQKPTPTPLPSFTPAADVEKISEKSCTEITAFMRFGAENDPEQVRLLQRFLRDHEGAAVEETGIFDRATLAAVHAFQEKYAEDILSPWNIGYSTGIVSITTRKKINELLCNTPRQLTPEEWQEIQKIIQ